MSDKPRKFSISQKAPVINNVTGPVKIKGSKIVDENGKTISRVGLSFGVSEDDDE